MLEGTDSALRWRGLLTETLPYEVPVIFSNEMLFASLVKPSPDSDVRRVVENMRSKIRNFTIPYTYRIAKDASRFTTLSIIHPNQQIKVNNFYELYRQSILDYCANSEVTLRRPVAEMEIYSANPLEQERALKQGIPHIVPKDGAIDVSKMTSFFSYGRYNLLSKFIDSAEYRRLEKRFLYLRVADVSKCFFNIYTHSISWAIKGKDFAKSQGDVYSFESNFDRLMQCSNYNETNGIIVGPEISRIFAEIILQDVDRRLVRRMGSSVHNADFAVRRYVDDFFLFASNKHVLDTLMTKLEVELEHYKLFINTEKTQTMTRPFVTPITLARSELRGLIADMHACLDRVPPGADAIMIRQSMKSLHRLALDIRLISERYNVSFSAISGWVLSTLRTLLRRSAGMIRAASGDEARAALGEVAVIILEIAFYIAALDTRVRVTYSLCQIVGELDNLHYPDVPDVVDRLMHTVSEELSGIITSLLSARHGEDDDCVELYNLMIVGAHFVGADFLQSLAMRNALKKVLEQPKVTYFGFITAKFCLLKDPGRYGVELASLNQTARDRISRGRELLHLESELYLLACDYLSSPDIPKSDKRTLIQDLLGGRPSNATSGAAGQYLGFVDWTGVRISHVLARKELRPVYSWS